MLNMTIIPLIIFGQVGAANFSLALLLDGSGIFSKMNCTLTSFNNLLTIINSFQFFTFFSIQKIDR